MDTATDQHRTSTPRSRGHVARLRGHGSRPCTDDVTVRVLSIEAAVAGPSAASDLPEAHDAASSRDTATGRGESTRGALGDRLAVWRRRAHTLVVGAMATFVLSLGVAGGATPAQAIDLIPGDPVGEIMDKVESLLCFGTVDEGPRAAPPKAGDALYGDPSAFTFTALNQQFGNKSVTWYEMYGMDGLVWSEYRPIDGVGDLIPAGCLIGNMGPFIGNQIANQVLGWSQTVTRFTITVYEASANPDLLDGFNRPLKCIIEGCNGGKGLKKSLFLEYLTPVIMFGALWGAWIGLFRKQTVQAAQGGAWMVLSCAFTLVFLGAPDTVVDETNEFVGDISATVMNGVTSASSSVIPRDDVCYVDRGGNQRGTRMSACSMYKAMALAPWAAGQFGEPMGTELATSEKIKYGNRTTTDARFIQIDAQSISRDQWLEMGGSPAGYAEYFDVTELKQDRWDKVREFVENGGADMRMWSGDAYGERINVAFASLLGSLLIGLLVMLISFSTIVLAVGTVLLVMMSPVFLLIGIHPGFGRGIALKWLELLIGTAVKRIILAMMLAILVGMYQIILEMQMPWFTQMLLVAAIGVGALIYRKPLLETLNVINLGGSRSGLEQGGGGAQRMAKKAASASTGGGAGAIAAFAAGGTVAAVAGGALKGGVMGSRSGSPIRAATMGAGSGRRAARGSQRGDEGPAPRPDPYANAPQVDTMDTDQWPSNAEVVMGPDGFLYKNPRFDPATQGKPRPAPRKTRSPRGGSGGRGPGQGGAGPRPGGSGDGGDDPNGPTGNGPGGSGGSGPRTGGGSGGGGAAGDGAPIPVVPVTPAGTPITTSPTASPRPLPPAETDVATPSGQPPRTPVPGVVLPGAGVITGGAGAAQMGSVGAPAPAPAPAPVPRSGAAGGAPRAGTPGPAVPAGPAALAQGGVDATVAPASRATGGSPRTPGPNGAGAPSAGSTPTANGAVGLPVPVVAMPAVPRPPEQPEPKATPTEASAAPAQPGPAQG